VHQCASDVRGPSNFGAHPFEGLGLLLRQSATLDRLRLEGDGIQAVVEPVGGIGHMISEEVHPGSHEFLGWLPLLECLFRPFRQLFELLDRRIYPTRTVGHDQGCDCHDPNQNEYDVF
jgi:hypothetical protein